MPDGTDVYRGDISSGRDGGSDAERPSRSDYEGSQRARYLAKAASLGQVVLDDEPSIDS
jgi:hypothetical protein